MKVNVRMKNLPKEFDFKSNINCMDLIYHAKEMDNCYVVTVDDCACVFDKEDVHKHLVKKEYVICK